MTPYVLQIVCSAIYVALGYGIVLLLDPLAGATVCFVAGCTLARACMECVAYQGRMQQLTDERDAALAALHFFEAPEEEE